MGLNLILRKNLHKQIFHGNIVLLKRVLQLIIYLGMLIF